MCHDNVGGGCLLARGYGDSMEFVYEVYMGHGWCSRSEGNPDPRLRGPIAVERWEVYAWKVVEAAFRGIVDESSWRKM